ncbi:T9SS type A sorting domain-containing protein [Sabulibacter ruber]|uniref:T9SS type A sorting domain-containing protein n=1 Tax=Sabulibacter ruber TaxID=2811901 RepID=UPI001A973792|nr:T9SS type A sorting domain-containing protein [Sabulibacter ruber]
MKSLKVNVKAGGKSGEVTFALDKISDSKSVSALAECSTPLPVISGSPDLCAGEIVKFAIQQDMDYSDITWQVPTVGSDGKPSNWQILSGQNTNVVEVRVGDVSGTVSASVNVADCGTKVVSMATYIGDEIPVTITTVNGDGGNEEVYEPKDIMIFNAHANQGRDKREYVYNWEVPAGWTIYSGQGTSQLIVIAGSQEGFVELHVKTKADREFRYCGLGYAYVEVIQEQDGCTPPNFDEDEVATPDEICTTGGQTYRYSIKNPKPNIKYAFFLPDEFQEVAKGNDYIDFKVVAGTKPGPLFVTVVAVNENNCGAETVCIPAEVVDCQEGPCDKPVVALVAPDTVCNLADEPTTFRVAQLQEGVTYTFQLPEGLLVLDEGPGYVTVVAVFEEDQLGQAAAISVTATNDCGTTTAQESVVVTECGPGNPLPVTLTRFDGVSRNGAVELTWSTASEINNDRFEIERSTNGKAFAKVGEVKGAGNSSALIDYAYTDRTAAAGTVYYRLKQVDTDNTSEYSKVIAVNHSATASNAASVSVYPNPVTNGNVSIRFQEQVKGNATIRLVDLNGRVLHTQELSSADSEVSMNLNGLGLRAGVYMISVTANGRNTNQRIMVR